MRFKSFAVIFVPKSWKIIWTSTPKKFDRPQFGEILRVSEYGGRGGTQIKELFQSRGRYLRREFPRIESGPQFYSKTTKECIKWCRCKIDRSCTYLIRLVSCRCPRWTLRRVFLSRSLCRRRLRRPGRICILRRLSCDTPASCHHLRHLRNLLKKKRELNSQHFVN